MEYIRNKGLYLLESLEAHGMQTFTIEDARGFLHTSRNNVLAIVGNLGRKKRIISLTKGLYSLWHPSERTWGIHPFPIIDSLMRYRQSAYYVGLLSAADYYGACEQKPQVLQIVIPKQLKFRKAKDLALSFHVQKSFPTIGINLEKTTDGHVALSSPELTALDIFYFEFTCAGFRNVCQVIYNLKDRFNEKDLEKIITYYAHPSSIQKLGFIMEYYQVHKNIISVLENWARGKKLSPIALTPTHPKKGHVHSLWKVVKNSNIEIDS